MDDQQTWTQIHRKDRGSCICRHTTSDHTLPTGKEELVKQKSFEKGSKLTVGDFKNPLKNV